MGIKSRCKNFPTSKQSSGLRNKMQRKKVFFHAVKLQLCRRFIIYRAAARDSPKEGGDLADM